MSTGYWFTNWNSEKAPMLPGTDVHVFEGYYDKFGGWSDTKERVYESIRQAEYPDRPSRAGSTFICPDLRGAMKWAGSDLNPYWRVFEVAYTGKPFRTDARWWNDAQRSTIEECARNYWRGTKGGEHYPELLVRSKVLIVRELSDFKELKKMRHMVDQAEKERRERWRQEIAQRTAFRFLREG